MRRSAATGAIIALVIVAVFGIAYVSYNASAHNAMTTSSLVATNPLSPPSQTFVANTTIIGTTPIITAANMAPDQNPGVYNNYASCTTKQNNGTAQCYGELYQVTSGCLMLIVPVMDPNDNAVVVNQYYALHNLPATHPPVGSWVNVTGYLSQNLSSSNGQSCPLAYINVTHISE